MASELPPYIWPDTAAISADGHLLIGDCDTSSLAETYGTPLYVFDESTLRATMRAYRTAFTRHYPYGSTVHYASKALLNTALAQLVIQEQLALDVVSGGELFVARQAGVSMQAVHFHGNAKTVAEIQRALSWNVGAIVVDNFDELDLLAALSSERDQRQSILLRIAPGVDAHTHAHIATGAADSKFGFPLDAVPSAVARVLTAPGLKLLGLHAHIGSQITDFGSLQQTVDVLLRCTASIRDTYHIHIEEISAGGGLAVPYVSDDPAPSIDTYAATLSHVLLQGIDRYRLSPMRLTVEPGRSIVARAGVALYRVVARKRIQPTPFVHIDGGMADNIRPALYDARYTAVIANRMHETAAGHFHISGRYCESGDILLRDIALADPMVNDVIAIPVSGAYTLSMASTYNMVPRPAVILVKDGVARCIQRRESEEALIARDLPLNSTE